MFEILIGFAMFGFGLAIGLQAGHVLCINAIKKRIDREIFRVDQLHSYSMAWYRGYTKALLWVKDSIEFDKKEEET